MCEAESETDILWGVKRWGGDGEGGTGVEFFGSVRLEPSEKCKEGARE